MKSDNSKPKILCYAPYNSWKLHGLWETTILYALMLRQAEVKYVMCDGLYAACDLHWKAFNSHRDHMSCTKCMSHCANFALEMQLIYEWLGRYIIPSELRRAEEWANSIPTDQLTQAKYDDMEIGRYIKSSVHSNFRRSSLDLNDQEVEDIYRRYLYSGMAAYFALNRLLDDYRPDIVFMFNGRFSNLRILVELCKKKGIRYITHERGRLIESVRLVDNEMTISLKPRLDFYEQWSEIPLSQEELDEIITYMGNRRIGKDLHWVVYSPPPQDIEEVKSKLGVDPKYPVWTLFTTSDDEAAAFRDRRSVFNMQIDWVKMTVEYARTHPNINLIIRVHPNTAGKRARGNNTQQLEGLKALIPSLPSNAKMILPDDSISSYTLMDFTDLGLMFLSTVGLEMACIGKPSIMSGPSIIKGMPHVPTLQSAEDYYPLLEKYYNNQIKTDPVKLKQYGYRWAYAHFFRSSLPFPFVKMPDIHKGILTYNNINVLAPGRNKMIDNICKVFFEGGSFLPLPGPNEIIRSDDYELAKFQSSVNADAQRY